MKKRGMGSAIDWIVAVGIFIIYFGLVFVFFKPGVGSDFNEDSLLNIVEENFIAEGNWNITKRVIFINAAGNGNKDLLLYNIEDDLGFDLSENLQKFEVFEINEAVELKANKAEENAADKALDNLGKEGKNTGESSKITTYLVGGVDGLGFKFKLEEDNNKVVLVHSSKDLVEEAYDVGNDYTSMAEFDGNNDLILCKETDFKIEEEKGDVSLCGGKYTLGASELIKGLDLGGAWDEGKELIEMIDGSYDEIKTRWNFPQFKEFRILLYSPSEGINYDLAQSDPAKHFVIGEQVPPIDSEIHIRQFNTFILSDDGIQIPVTVHIMVW